VSDGQEEGEGDEEVPDHGDQREEESHQDEHDVAGHAGGEAAGVLGHLLVVDVGMYQASPEGSPPEQ
jgi:hypothetical protein